MELPIERLPVGCLPDELRALRLRASPSPHAPIPSRLRAHALQLLAPEDPAWEREYRAWQQQLAVRLGKALPSALIGDE